MDKTSAGHSEADIHSGTYQLWDVPDVEGNLDETPVAPGAHVLAAVMVGVPQTDQDLQKALT